MVGKIRSLGLQGVGGYEVSAEIFLSGGLPQFDVVGLPDAAVREARDRVRASIKNCGLDFPVSRVTANLAPADRRKAGGRPGATTRSSMAREERSKLFFPKQRGKTAGKTAGKSTFCPSKPGKCPNKSAKKPKKNKQIQKLSVHYFSRMLTFSVPPEACEIRAEKQEKPTYCAS